MKSVTRTNRCRKCILPDNYPGIEFTKTGICSHCIRYKSARYLGEEELYKFLQSFSQENADFDVVVGVSGGRDSSYVLYYLAKICKLRVLAYCADNGFIPLQTKIQIKKMADRLKVRLIIEKHNLLKKHIKANLHSWLRKPSPGMVPMICCGCKLGMFSGLLKCAKAYKIPLVAIGMAPIERTEYKRTFLRTNPFGNIIGVRNFKKLSLLFGLLYETLRNPFYFLKPGSIITYAKEYLYFFDIETMRRLFYPKQRILFFYKYIKWDEKEIQSTIENECGMPAPSWRSDCKVSLIRKYLMKKTVGFTDNDDILSNMIRENMITREEALERLKEKTFEKKLLRSIYAEVMA